MRRPDESKLAWAWLKMPQIGCAILGRDVGAGFCPAIERGAIGDTPVADGVKTDSRVEIADVVQMVRHTAIAGGAVSAASSGTGACRTSSAVPAAMSN